LNYLQNAPRAGVFTWMRSRRTRQVRFPYVTLARSSLLLLLALLIGCRACSRTSGLAVGGAHPYVRCLAGDPPIAGDHKVGRLTLRVEKRELKIDGLPSAIRIAAFSGPASGAAPSVAAVAAVQAANPDLVLLLGDVGDDPATAATTLTALAKLPVPVLVLAGGRDTPARIAEGMSHAPAGGVIVDVTALRSIRLGHETLVPVAGARDGVYALAANACGYAESDLAEVAASQAAGDRARRWLLAWEAPASAGRFGVARTEAGADLGSVPLATLGKRVGAAGGIFAWPHVQALRASASGGEHRPSPGVPSADLQVVVPRLSGAAIERSDGSRVAPGFALLELGADGLRLLETREAPP
jgi:hypothetical protein